VHGLEVLKRLRGRGDALPVLILTAADRSKSVQGLDYGADDYMAKPFALSELEARVRALTRRGMGGASSTIKHGPLVYDQTGRVATIDGKMVELSARELGLLEVLLQRAGRLVSKDQLVERLCEWGEEVSNNAIEVYIHRLRKKIEKGPIRIATVRGLGYCLEKSLPERLCLGGPAASPGDGSLASGRPAGCLCMR
jgi:two-component system OmpR family response regulator